MNSSKSEFLALMRKLTIIERIIMTVPAGLAALQAADALIQQQVSQLLVDFATAITNANGDPAAIAQVTSDLNQVSANILAGDPTDTGVVTPITPVVPSS